MMNSLVYPESSLIHLIVAKSIDFHCHGVGHFDFTEVPALKLQEIEDILSERQQQCILTIYLPQPNFEKFLDLMDVFDEGKKAQRYPHIAGFALEGPLLASHGGTPEIGVWMPSIGQWQRLAQCGKKGLVYTVLSPDASFTNTDTAYPKNITQITEILLEGGVLPAPGHFIKTNPTQSARLLQIVFDVVAAWNHGPIITDHLFNDMPLNFKHSWRTPEEKARREEGIKSLNMATWNLKNLDEKLGPVPAVIIKNALKGHVKICQNFDGEHVDLAVIKKAVELIGAENMLMMTDAVESKRLAGRDLTMKEGSTLLYQDKGIVAAGSQTVAQQVNNMFSIGLNRQQIDLITHHVPTFVLQQRLEYIEKRLHDKADCI